MSEPELTRRTDWVPRLNALIAQRRERAREWGVHDCCLWPADAVEAITGTDFGAPFRETYTDARGAAEALRLHGGGTVVRTFDRFLTRIAKASAWRGDLALHDGHVGVIIGGVALFVPAEGTGFVRIPRADWTICWRVGH